MRPSAAFIAEARIVAFWPYRERVLATADASDGTRAEWATAYLRALAAWAAEDRQLAAYVPAGAPLCVQEDMAVIAGGHMPRAAGTAAAKRLCVLAGDIVRSVLSDASVALPAAFGTVQDEVRSLLGPSPAALAEQILAAIGELADRMTHGGGLTPEQASRLQGGITGLGALLAERHAPQQEAAAG